MMVLCRALCLTDKSSVPPCPAPPLLAAAYSVPTFSRHSHLPFVGLAVGCQRFLTGSVYWLRVGRTQAFPSFVFLC